MEERPQLVTFNRGILSAIGLGRIDIDRYALSAETMTNWMPRVLGSMMLRPGWQYLGSTHNDARVRCLPFVFSQDQKAVIEVSAAAIRVWVDDAPVNRASVSTTVSNGGFTSDLTGWTDVDDTGGTSEWATGGYMKLTGDGENAAIRRQELSIAIGDQGVEHAIRVVVARGEVTFRIGSAAGDDDYLSETRLGVGTHSLAFTPTGASAYVEVFARNTAPSLVESIDMESDGTMTLPSPWAEDDLKYLRIAQSGDIIYVACSGYRQRTIERRSQQSWSIVEYESDTGPFRTQNTTGITLTPSALNGEITLTASKPIFRTGHVGALFRVESSGQRVEASISADDTFSDPIRVVGVGEERRFSISITGTWSGTVTVQYSVGEPGAWIDYLTYAANTAAAAVDGQDNQIIYYRIGIKAGDYTSGTAEVALDYESGAIEGVARVTGYTSETEVDAVVLESMGETEPSSTWWEGEWSDYRGWPTAVELYEGRLWWAGKDKIWASVSNAYDDFDDTFEGDAGPITRNIGKGPIDDIHWMLGIGRMMMGVATNSANVEPGLIDGNSAVEIRSSGYDEPITPTNFNLKWPTARAVYVDRTGQRLYEISYDYNYGASDYNAQDLSLFAPDLNAAGIERVVVQMKPDVRAHCIRSDGTVAALVYDRAENVVCWIEIETAGSVEDCVVLPGTEEDQVYYVVRRTVNGATKRYLERWAMESECQGGTLNKQADSFVEVSPAGTTISGLDHLEGLEVVLWADGKDLGTYTVDGGLITASEAVTSGIVGLTYTAQFKSTKLGRIEGVGLTGRRRIAQLGVILRNTHYQGLQYGPSFDHLRSLPVTSPGGAAVAADTVYTEYDQDPFPFGGDWSTDSRLCLQAQAPRPAQILAATLSVSAHRK